MMNMAGNTCASDRPFCFVSQDELPSGEAYEAYISRTKRIPTRNNLHDLFNAACWLRFPAIKRRLNDLQSAELVRLGVGSTRGPVRDALTLFDENAILVSGPAPLRDAMLVRDWHALFVRHRPLWSQTRMTVFGHALLEKLVRPYKSITAHALWVDTEPADQGMSIESWDTQLERSLTGRLTPELLASKPFCPLPVMGLPGWCAQNEAPDFYLDTEVFRPARR